MSDTETLDDCSKKTKVSDRDDFSGMTATVLTKVNFKVAIFIFLLGILVFSDVYIENALSKFKGASHDGQATTKGTMLQLMTLVIGYIIIDLLVQGGCL